MTVRRITAALAVAILALAGPALAQSPELGTITFPNSGAAAAQPSFLRGVKALHSFEFAEAAEAFKEAEKADPDFALAYWGEAMSFNHPLWAQQDVPAARKALEKLAPTREARLAKAKLPKEKQLLEAQEVLYGEGEKLARDVAYEGAMARMYADHPEDHEVAILYALSLLGSVRPGDPGYRRQMLAASIAEQVFRENPNHPGAAHFIIHSFDDPEHAPLGLPAARAYAKIAPAAPHALHMPSHIFVQLGMWEEVAASNTVAYEAAMAQIKRRSLPEGREDFHTLSWLAYANLMLGRYGQAQQNVELARQAAERHPDDEGVQAGYRKMRARYVVETGRWEKGAVGESAAAGAEHAGMPGMAQGYGSRADVLLASGLGAARTGDVAQARKAEAALRSIREGMEGSGQAYGAKSVAIMEKEVGALASLAEGKRDDAVRLVREAADVERTMAPPSGPPEPIKPALEALGDVLLEAGRAKEAAAAYEQGLLRTPRRTPSLLGAARAAAQAGDAATARQHYAELAKIWAGAEPGFTPGSEARRYAGGGQD